MKTITVSLDDETYRRTCAKAAEAGTDVDELVRAYLCEYAETPDERFDRLRRHQEELLESMKARGGGLDSRENLTREELYDRAVGLIDDNDAKPTSTAT
ncbi:MAG: hypothetical protein OXH07_12985 [Chloroflexi bacterium]|nr:hypothetical protein [Chloroflexota bacterium]